MCAVAVGWGGVPREGDTGHPALALSSFLVLLRVSY